MGDSSAQQASQQARASSSWLLAIAGFTFLNSVLWFAGVGVRMLIGLTSVLVALSLSSGLGTVGLALSAAATLLAVGLFAALGVMGRRGSRTAITLGFGAYVLDGILTLLFADWLGLLLHVVGAFGIASLWRQPSRQVTPGEAVLVSGNASRVLRRSVGYLSLILGGAFGLSLVVVGVTLLVGGADLAAAAFVIFLGFAFCGLCGYMGFRILSSARRDEAAEKEAA